MTTLTDIADLAELLCDPHQHTETVQYWANRNRKFRRHVTIQPGLLHQLHEAVFRQNTADEGRRGSPGSRPPLQLEALSLHVVIQVAVTRWCWELNVTMRDSTEQDIRALVGAAMDSDTQTLLRADLRRWRTWCEVMTGWETVWAPKGVTCPVAACGQQGSLRVLLAAKRAFCRNPARTEDGGLVCGATWDQDTIGVLADYISSQTATPPRPEVKVHSGKAGNGGWLADTSEPTRTECTP